MYFHNVNSIQQILDGLLIGDKRMLARAITIVENELKGYEQILSTIKSSSAPIIGITGPPGAGKSTLINALVAELIASSETSNQPVSIAVLAVDPTSPFSHGSLLGDRLRLSEHFNNQQVFIRSLATRGALGGLSAKTLEIIDVIKACPFDFILIETVGVGQSEVEIVSLADTTIVVLVPESGDEIQALKSGIMEIGDIFVVNKSDRDASNKFANGLTKSLHERTLKNNWAIPVVKTVASKNEGIDELIVSIKAHQKIVPAKVNVPLLAERAFQLIQRKRMKDISIENLEKKLALEIQKPDFNLYTFIQSF
jgi:LAO/AO transport system kinase